MAPGCFVAAGLISESELNSSFIHDAEFLVLLIRTGTILEVSTLNGKVRLTKIVYSRTFIIDVHTHGFAHGVWYAGGF
jgi:hypothetical protein